MLTARGFNQLALAANTPRGVVLRDIVFVCMNVMKQLTVAVQTGTHAIVRVADSSPKTRDAKRLKACDTNKALMRAMVDTDPSLGAKCGWVNGTTNKKVTGKYKHELAKCLGMDAKRVNARDYMTPEQLAATELAEMISAKKVAACIEQGKDFLEVHKEVCKRVVSGIEDELHNKVASEPRKLYDVRRDAANPNRIKAPKRQRAIEAQGPPAKLTTTLTSLWARSS